ncbi:phosphatase PAP2-related protein [Bdellovibrio sp. 22V]|uniref:phosphatase PAP2-related protein n=1 Tax=Bdellovibrio TaxID=958 RepID=UPI002543B357|nr:phosphatase PAP2-related protein [Bdellovibrio sp. 22V]WII72565.1 phosphatase PAP2-related protein [Bdellovibrio sp. 22V]
MTIAIKIGMTVAAIGMWLFTQKLLGRRQMKFKDRIGDVIHMLTEKWSLYLNNSPRAANGLLISSSLVIDAVGIFLIVQTLFGDTVRPLLALLVLFTLRQINQAITVLPTPEGMIWRNPGVPSIFVTYDVSNDLFFSGHTALAVLGALEIAQLGGGMYMALACFIVVFEIATVILLRAHWTMDVFAGAIAALWTHDVVSRVAPALDAWIASL